jgi:carboxyl-terminal processing protease
VSINQGKSKYQVLQPLLLSVVLSIGIVLGYKMNEKADGFLVSKIQNEEGVARIGQVEEVLKMIESRYIDNLDIDGLADSAIKAIVDQLDPHSVYISPYELDEANNRIEGAYEGIGLEHTIVEDTPTVVKILDQSPAQRAGIKQFDKILSINNISLIGLSHDSLIALVEGINGSIDMKYASFGDSRTIKSASLMPEKIVINSASLSLLLDQTTGIIKIDQISADTYKDFMRALETLTQSKTLRNLIIDLRYNPGGYLPEATKILNQLVIEADKLLVYTVGRSGNKREYRSNGKAFYDIPNIVVLVNEESASGAEVIAGALQDLDRALVIGRRTFGKGLVQEQFNLSNGGAIRLTTSKYFLPSGRNIQRSFEDEAMYSNDIYNRLQDSSLFTDKRKTLDSSTAQFKSLGIGRFLASNSGVDPDIFIPADTALYNGSLNSVYGFITPFAVKYHLSKMTSKNDTELVNKFLAYASKQKNSSINASYTAEQKTILVHAIKEEVSRIVSTDPLQQYTYDKFVMAALNYFKNPQLANYIK